MKKNALLILVMSTLLTLTACSAKDAQPTVKVKPVRTEIVEQKSQPVEISYLGTVEADQVKKYSFLSGGVIEDITVSTGDVIESDFILATLARDKLNIAINASAEQTRAAQLEYAKAKQSYNYYQNLLNDTKALLDAGAVSRQRYDEIKLQRDVAAQSLSQAAANAEQARLDKVYNQDNADDATLLSDMSGTVLDVLYKEGEVVAQGYPVVVVRSNQLSISVGMTAQDIKQLAVGDTALIELSDGRTINATVDRINFVPDDGSRTYTATIVMEKNNNLLIGESVKVVFQTGVDEGIWLPIAHILNDGESYVYRVVDGRAKRSKVDIIAMSQNLAKVEGLAPGDELVVAGTSTLADGYRVKVEPGTGGDSDE